MRRISLLLALALVAAVPARAQTAPPSYADVPQDQWFAASVKVVAQDHDWMASRDGSFRPDALVTRREFARAIVRAFAAGAQPDQSIAFNDLPSSDPDYPPAAIAVKLGWMIATASFQPDNTTTKRQADRALLLALGAQSALSGLNAIATQDGQPITHANDLAPLALGSVLGLQHNYTPDESEELMPWSRLRRRDAAFAIARAVAVAGQWQVQQLQRYNSVQLPVLTEAQRTAVQFALSYVGYPYVWGGEWFRPLTGSSCCGAQASGGFDCSGFSWWAMRAPSGAWDNTNWRKFQGWPLPERTSTEIAKATLTRIPIDQVQPLDVLLFDTDSVDTDGTDWQSVDHVAIALGNGWMIHSSGARTGVTIDAVGDGWWRDHFRWARRILPA